MRGVRELDVVEGGKTLPDSPPAREQQLGVVEVEQVGKRGECVFDFLSFYFFLFWSGCFKASSLLVLT